MSDYEDYQSTDRGEGEVLSTYVGEDDGCNHLPSLIWQMRARANIRKPYQPKPKPVYCACENNTPQSFPKKYHVGKRLQYSRNIFMCIYQLSRRGINESVMSDLIGIPLDDIRKILKHKTETQAKAWRYIQQQPLNAIPGTNEILRRLQREDKNDISNSKTF